MLWLRLIYISAPLIMLLLLDHKIAAADFRQSETEFESFKRQSDAEFQSSKDEFELYREKLLRAFDQYKYQSAQIWGDRHTVLPSRSNWVSYQDDLQHRSVVDFERGTVKVELALAKDQVVSDANARKQLAASIVRSLNQGQDKRSMLDIASQPAAVSSGPAVLQGQVADFNGHPADSHNYEKLAQQAVARASRTTIKGNDGKQRLVYSAQLNLLPDHIKQRAVRFQKDVNTQANEQRIAAPLVFAIMETESMFNPTARSPAPAFGLMQLVPTAGAREAYQYLHQRDRIVSDTYLYNPTNNIRLGTAFLNRLYYKYLVDITNAESRQWATIAAYNTGAGNVLRTFAGKYSQTKFGNRTNWTRIAIREINRRSPEQVYDFLRKNLPYSETRNYIQKVRSRIGKYANGEGV